jgi:dihydrofolate synthase/folylpolyglutamate synthase
MNYAETTLYLFSQLPQFEKDGAKGYKEGLQNSLALDAHFGHPHRSFRTIHVAGTNGKGSCSHSLAAILQTCGYRVGLYTSPHLVDFRERIRINGHPISEDYVVGFVEHERHFFESLHPTFFELATAMAFKYFSDMKVDIAVIEVGLGGRLDCTNIITPMLSVITNISFDHTQFLGDTLAKIAAEKAGIIKRGIPVVIGETTAETRPVFEEKAKSNNAPLVFAEDEKEVLGAEPQPDGTILYHTLHYGELKGELGGLYQTKNTNTVLCAIRQLEQLGILCRCTVPENQHQCQEEINDALLHVCQLTGLQGRWQTIRRNPLVICDTGHNLAGWEYLSRQLKEVKCRHMHIVFGMVDDKDVDNVMKLLPTNASYYFTKADNHRAISEHVLLEKGLQNGLSSSAFDTVEEAYRTAFDTASTDDFIFVGGSSYVVADFLKKCI